MHWIQKHILQQLATHENRRYIELKPENVDGNLFMYHMQQLQKSGYVAKDSRTYLLSTAGKLFASRMSLRQASPLLQPKIVVMIVHQNAAGKYLLFRWQRQPYFGLVSFPFSKLHFGRTLEETLQEAWQYKTQLRGQFISIGSAYVRVLNGDETAEHTLAHIYKATDVIGEIGACDGMTGEPFWGTLNNIPESEQVPGFASIYKLVEAGRRGFIEEISVYS